MNEEMVIKLAEKVQETLVKIDEGNRRFDQIEDKLDKLRIRMEKGIFGVFFTVFVVIGGLFTAPERIISIIRALLGVTSGR